MKSDNEDMIIRQKVSSGLIRKMIHLDNLMVVVCDFTDGPAKIPDLPHSHPHEQITYVAQGKLKFFKGDQEFHLKKGDLITIPADVPHCIQTLSKHVILIDSFHPVRKDFLKH